MKTKASEPAKKMKSAELAALIARELKSGRIIWLFGVAGSGKSTVVKLVREILEKEGLAKLFYDWDNAVRPVWDLKRFGDEDDTGSELFDFWLKYVTKHSSQGFGICCNYEPGSERISKNRMMTIQVWSPELTTAAYEKRNAAGDFHGKKRSLDDVKPFPPQAGDYLLVELGFESSMLTENGRG